MSESQARIIRDLRAENAALTARPSVIGAVLADAADIRFAVASAPTITVHLNAHPEYPDRWSVVRFGWQEPVALAADGAWQPLAPVDLDDQYVWSLTEALERVPALLLAEAQAHAAWSAKRTAQRVDAPVEHLLPQGVSA
jgi:hypothetical protein